MDTKNCFHCGLDIVEKEEIILPISSKIRYFSNETIFKYIDCLDFINSLKTSICFTSKIENIKKLSINP